MRTCPKCRSHSYAYRTHPTYGMVYICDFCKIEGEILIHATKLLREVRTLSPLCWYYDGSGGKLLVNYDVTAPHRPND